jgi:drug/metabolite transporter (DMT)-like permease
MLWWQVLFLLGAGCMAAGAQFSLTAAYTYAPAKSISVYDYTQVLFTALWGLLFLSELPDWISIIGYVIIIGAAVIKYMVSRKEEKRLENQK